MTIIETADLTGTQLDWFVAKALGLTSPENIICPECHGHGEMTYYGYGVFYEHEQCRTCKGNCQVPMPQRHNWWPPFSTSWEHTGPIIEREMMGLMPVSDAQWRAADVDGANGYGPTPLIAAVRCFVAAKLGDSVDVHEELA